ncbi:MAG TPA: M50 family metallopeptidase [Ktedonobacteraceae bacterium]|jgi:regulator of sigma E protease|nr:M50 family metallopeptidase [Ktedonobacteraceae bacterium]
MTLTNPWFLLAAIPVFGLCVLIHELGHFLTAKWAGIRVEEFGLGLPPRVLGFRKRDRGGWEVVWFGGPRTAEDAYDGEQLSRLNGTEKHPEQHHTIYSINLLPIGGFVRMPGENGEVNDEHGNYDPGSFASKTAGKRIIVLVAGVTMNVILAMVLFIFAYGVGQPVAAPQVGSVVKNSPAAAAGLRPGDTFIEVNGQPVHQFSDVQDITDALIGQQSSACKKDPKCTVAITAVIRHAGQKSTVTTVIHARVDPPQGQGPMGIVSTSNVVLIRYPFWEAPIRGVGETFSVTGQFISTIGQIITGRTQAQISGPVGIVKFTGEVAQSIPVEGWWPILSLTAILNINLAIVNILPFPALDGGRVFLILIELLRGGKRLKPELEGMINLAGMAILLALMVIITVSDVLHWSS